MMKNTLWTILTILNLCLYLALIGMWVILTDYTLLNLGTTAFSLLLTMVLLYQRRESFIDYVSSSHFENLVSKGLGAFLVFLILGMVNYLAYTNPKQFDFTPGQVNTLSAQSRSIVNSLEGEVHFRVFAGKNERQTILPLLDLYRYSSSNLKIDVIDPVLRPDLAKKFEVERQGTVVLSYGDRSVTFNDHSEKAITEALLKVKREAPTIAFSKGHKELQLDDSEKEGLSSLFSHLKNSAFNVRSVNLATLEKLQEVAALVILGPKTNFLEQELKVIEEYIQSGGRVFFGLDPDLSTESEMNISGFIKSLGIQIGKDLVVDTLKNVNGSQGLVPIVSKFNDDHPITKGFQGTTFFPLTSSVSVLDDLSPDVKAAPLFYTSGFPASWAERDLQEAGKGSFKFNEKEDLKGPIPLGVSLERKFKDDKKGKVVVLGNSTFVANSYAAHGNNLNLFMNILSWLIDEDYQISFDRPGVKDEPVFLSPIKIATVFYACVLLMPLIFISIAIFLYKRRKVL